MAKKELILSIFAALLVPAPLMIAAVLSGYKESWGFYFPVWTVYGILTVFFGYAAGYAVKKSGTEKPYLRRIILAVLGAAILLAGIFAVFRFGMSSAAAAFIPIAVFWWYLLGCKAGLGLDLLTYTVLGGICIEAAFLFPVCLSFDGSGKGARAVLTIFGAEILICAVLLNIRHLRKITVRGNSVSAISKSTVRFNSKISVMFALTVLFFFIFARYGAYWLWEGLKALIKFLLSLTREPEKIDTQVVSDTLKFGQLFSGGNSPAWLIIMLMITAAAVLFLIKPIRNAILELLEKINKRLRGIGAENAKKLAYTDFYESVPAGEQRRLRFRQAYRHFKKEKDPCRKYRLGYKAFIIGLCESGEEVLPSDTTLDHLEMEERAVGSGYGDMVIRRYERLRYNDEGASAEDCDLIKEMLKNLCKIYKNFR